MLAQLRQIKRHTAALFVLAFIPALGLLVNVVDPPAHNGYYQEQALLLVLALAALWVSRDNPTGAIWLYCALALLPVWGMVEAHQAGADNMLALVYVVFPFVGLAIIAATTRDERAVLAYVLPMAAYGHGIGMSFGEDGLSGILIMASALGTLGMMWIVNDCNLKTRLAETCEKLERVEMGQKRITGELKNVQGQGGPTAEHTTR